MVRLRKKTIFIIISFVINSIPQAPNGTVDIIESIRENIKWYLVLGAASVVCYFVGYSLWV